MTLLAPQQRWDTCGKNYLLGQPGTSGVHALAWAKYCLGIDFSYTDGCSSEAVRCQDLSCLCTDVDFVHARLCLPCGVAAEGNDNPFLLAGHPESASLQALTVERKHWIFAYCFSGVTVSSASFSGHSNCGLLWEAPPFEILFTFAQPWTCAVPHDSFAHFKARGQRGLSVAQGSPPGKQGLPGLVSTAIFRGTCTPSPVRVLPSSTAFCMLCFSISVPAPSRAFGFQNFGFGCPYHQQSATGWCFLQPQDHCGRIPRDPFSTSVLPRLRALNTCIGSSGTRASVFSHRLQSFSSPDRPFGISRLAACIQGLFETFLGLLFVAILKLLIWCLPGGASPFGRLVRCPFAFVPQRAVLPLGKVGGTVPCLDWSPAPRRQEPRNRKNKRSSTSALTCPISRLQRAISWLCICSLPVQIWAVPPGTPEAVNALRQFVHRTPEHLPATANGRTASQLGSPIATASVAFALPGGPHHTAAIAENWPTPLSQPTFLPQTVDPTVALRVAYPSVIQGNGTDNRLLGVLLYAPHYRTEIWAVHVPPNSSADDLRQSVQGLLSDAFRGALDRVAPMIPQLHDSCAQYVAYPSVLDQDGSLGVAVVFDLSRVGGAVFAAVVARVLQECDFIPFIRPLTRRDIEEFSFYIGAFATPATVEEHLTLSHGTVITVLPRHFGPPRDFAVSDLFRSDSIWSQIQHVPRSLHTPCLCAIFGKHRFVIRQDLHSGRTIPEAIEVVLDRPVDTFTICSSFDFEDLDVHGEQCDRVIAVAAVPPQSVLPLGLVRRDVWIFCDYRPLGHKPRTHLSHVFRTHIPSLLALDGIQIPSGFDLSVQGGVCDGDEIIIGSQATLIFKAKASPVTDFSSDILPDPPSSDDDDDDHGGDESGHDNHGSAPSHPHRSGQLSGDPVVHNSSSGPSRSRSPAGDRPKNSRNCQAFCFDELRIPTPPIQEADYFAAISWQAEKRQEPVSPVPLTAKQPDRAGDSAHPIGPTLAERVEHLDQLLHQPDLRDGPNFPIDPAELLRRRTRPRGDFEAPETDLPIFLHAPQCTPEVLLLPLRIPCTVQDILQAIAESRDEIQSARFPEVIIADPQPDTAFASFLLAPAWAVAKTLVLFDCRDINGALFSQPVWSRLNRESLCSAAGISHGPETQVFVQGLPWALGPWQSVDIVTGSTIAFLRRGQPAPQRHILEDMLFNSDSWDGQTAVPAPPGHHYLLLTEGISHLFTLTAGNSSGYRGDIAQQLQYLEQNMTLQGARPRVDDAVYRGHHLHAVVVATEAICQLPVPPARIVPQKWILVLDLRDLLLPFAWKLLASDTYPVQDIIREFAEARPDGFIVSITGAPIENWPSGPVFRFRTGQTLRVSYITDQPDDSTDPGHGRDIAPEPTESEVTHDSDEEMTDENAAPPSVTQHLDNDAPTRGAPDDNGSPVSSFGPVNITACFGILIPGFALERIALEIEIPSTVSVVTALLQQRRNQDIAIDFPGLVPANPQPDARWGLFLALPLWGPLLNTICVDIFATRQLLFAVPAPATADRDILCDLAGLPNGVDFDVYVDFYGPVAEQLTVDLCSGSTICFVPSGTQRPWSIQLSAMLETHLPWDDSAPFPDDGAFDRYCLACADGMRVFPMIPDRARLYREDIAARLQCPSRLLQLVPASPGPRDIAFFGLKCRNVIAALDRSNMRADDRTTVGLLDARRIYKGWLPLVSNEGWLDVCAVLEQVAVDLPLGWRARLEGLEDNQRHVYLEDGLVLVAVARPARDGITASTAAPPSGCIAQPLGQTDGHPSAAPAPSVSSSCAPGSIDGQLGTRGSPSANSSYDAVAGRCRKSAKIAVQPEMWILCLILQAIRDGSTGLTPSRLVCAVFCLAFSFFAQAIVHRARGTQATRCNLLFVLLIISLNAMPCEAMQWKRGDATPDWHSASGTHNFGSSVPFSVGPRPIPTPCRAPTIHHPHVHAEHVSASRQDEKQDTCQFASDGPTLLECSLYEMSGQPFWEAATLLETLHEHFAGHMIRPTAPRVSGQPSGTPIDLASSLPACQTHDLTPVVFRLGRTLDDVVPLFATKWTLPTVLPAEVRLHRSTRLALGDMISDPPHFPPSVFDLYTDGSFNGSVSGWSFVVIATWPQGSSVYGFARGLVHLPGDPLYLGAREHSAINGEKTALFWAHAWLLQKPSISAARIWADCLPALGQTQGEYQLGEGDLLARACRSIAQAAASAGQICQTAYAHVNSHCGEPFNELADVLAKAFQLAETPIPPAISKFVEWVERDDLPWLWLLVDAFLWPEAWPTHAYSLLADNKPTGRPNETDLRSCLVTTVDNTAPVLTGSESALRFQPKVLSINVQTLEENSDTGVEGRVPYIREQLEALQVCIAGLQETRARQSATFVSETHLRYLSQKDTSGNLGIELWLSRTIPFAWRHQQPLVFGQDDIRVVYTDPRTLIAKFTRDMLRFFIVVVHAPTAADSSRNTWWKSLHDRLVTLVKGVPVLLLGDFNTRCQHEITGRVGDLLCEAGQPVPPYLSKLFAVLDLWLPSTFSGIHSGASYTWMSPGHGSASRIDYIALPTRWRAKSEGSYVLHDVDFGQKGIDHFAIALQVDVWLYQRCKSHNGPRRIDTACMQHPDARGVLTNICQQTPDVPWAVDPHTHYSMLAEHWSSSLVRAFPCSQKRARRTYFSDGTWDLRQRRVELRRQLSRDSRSGLHTELAAAFESWNGQTTFLSTVARGVGECLRCLCQVKRDLQELRSLQPQLKRSIRADRRAYIAEIAKSARATTTKDVVQKLRPLLGLPKRRQKGPLALPLVELENGDFAQDAAEADQRWIRHFSAIEDGGPIQVEEHINACWKRQSDRDLESLDLHYADVPSLLDIERSLRASHCGKAIGNDGVPADLLHLQAANVAKAVFKVFFKTALRLQEPIAWKGGSLHAIWKGKGSQSDCANYRAILVSSATGKSIHGALREKCAPLMDRACTPLQIGGRKGQPVQVATHAVRAFQTACITRKKPCAVLFVDLREAFHRVVRPLIHGGSLDDHHVAGLIKELGLEPDTVHRLHAYVRESSLLAESGSTQWTAAIMHEVGEDAWFSFGKTGGFAHVRGGTRPGDNLADMVFTFLFSEVSKRIRDGFQQAGITSCLPWHETWLCGLPDGSVEPDDICSPVDATWMDDMSILLQANSSQELIERLRTAATTTLDECLQAVLLPNLRQGKTEAVVSFVGKGSLKTAKQAFEGSDPTLLLQSSIWPDARLRFAAVYKHLGGLIQVGGGLKLEFKARVGSAWQAFNKHKRLIFGSPVVTLQEKSILFTSLVESTLYYGAGTWSLVRPAEKDKLQGCLLQMARQMLRPRYSHEQARHLSPMYVLATARIASANTSLSIERLRHLKSVVLKATAELWAILHYEGHWLNEMQDTLEWFRRQHHHSNSLLPLWETWKGVVDYIRTSPNGWKRAVNKAKRTAILRELWQAECQQHHGLVFRALTKLGAVVPEDVVDHVNKRELCAKCGVVFDDLRAWSHHAFKRHGRVNPVRALAHGTQCAVCLKHFSTNKRLCNHLEYSRPCRHALINAGYSCQPAPGTGSRKFDDGHRCLQPATQAQGPERCWDFAEALDETHTPCAYVISRLEDCFYATDCHFPSRHHLLQHIKGLFQEHCLQQSRMRATVKAWQVILADALDADDDVSILWATWHSQVARYLEHVDFVEWLGEGCEGVDQAAAIYQQAEALLPWLEVPCQVFEKSQAAFAIGVCVNRWEPALVNFDNDHCVYLMHQQCKEAPRLICPTTWISQLRPGSCVFLSCDGLVDNLGPPLPLRSFKSIDGPLRSLRLFSDLLRCTLFLWERCVPACLYLPVIICPSAEAVRKAALFALPLQQGTIVSNFRLEGQAPFVSLLLI